MVILGDINTSHHLIDHCEGDSRDPQEFYDNPGRTFLSQLLLSPSKVRGKVGEDGNGVGEREKVETTCEGQGSETTQEIVGSGASTLVGESGVSDSPSIGQTEMNASTTDISQSSGITAIESRAFVDAFRMFHPTRKEAFTCWNTTIGARATNYGTRIDYIFPDVALTKKALVACDIMPNIEGSDHCPVKAEFHLDVVAAGKCAPSATKYWPEFAGGKQKTLNAFFQKRATSDFVAGSSAVGETRKRSMDADFNNEAKRKKVTAKEKPKPRTLLDFVSRKPSGGGGGGNRHEGARVGGDCSLKNSPSSEGGLSLAQTDSQKENATRITTANVAVDDIIPTDAVSSSTCATKKNSSSNEGSSDAWKKLLKGPDKAPLCKGHREPCVGNKVKKPGPNFGKKFYACARPTGLSSNKEARCNHFEWAK